MRKSPRYIAVAGIFLLAIYYNLAIALPPEKPNDVAKNQGDASMMATKTFADLDLSHPSKRYEHFLLSVPGDWYRVGLVAQSLDEDEDESLRVSLVSAFGKNQELGTVTVTKGDGERYFEFLILADASYEDVLVEKVQSASGKNVWAGGQVRLTNMFVSRLSVKDTRDIKALAPTVFGEKDARITLTDGEDVSSGINLPRDTHFLQGQTFKISGDAYLLSANIRIKQNNRFGSGKYRIELREYEPVSKKVGDQPLRRTTFSVKDLKSLIDAEGSYRLNVPYRLEAGKSYFLGISDDYVKSGKKIALETFHSVDDTANVTSSYFSLSTVNTVRGKDLLTHAVVEDLGPSFRYRYAAHHTVTDMMDVFASSDKVSFDSGTATVMGKESVGTFFTYKIDTMRPFGDFRMEATQVGNDDNQVRLEYSFDNDFWKEIPSMDGQVNDASKTFDLILHDAGKQTSVVYVRVSYAGLKDGSGSFGLSNFRVTATMPKDTSQKLSR